MFDHLFQPFQLGPLSLRNRIVMPPMVTDLASEVGGVTQRMIDYYVERARGGVGMVIVESAYVREEDRDFGRLAIENPQFQIGLAELAEAVQEQGAKIFLQINHRGSVLAIRKGKGPNDLNREEIGTIIESFALAAARAQKAGFNGVEIHGANIYLITQFLSPLTNQRQEEYGKDQQGRTKFARDVVLRVREKVGKDYPVIMRMVGNQYTDGGLQLEDGQAFARAMEEAGVSCLHVSAGSPANPYLHTPPGACPRGIHAELAGQIKQVVRIPVIAVGRINHPELADRILAEGKADLVAMGRAVIADPEMPLKARRGDWEDIRLCVACNYCRKRVIQLNRSIRCAVNPQTGRERDSRLNPAPDPRKVLVVGGGPGGMEAARVLALRGHQVSLYEAGDQLGGQVHLAVLPPHKEEWRNILDYLTHQMKKLNVQLHLRTRASAETVQKEGAEVVILATGAVPVPPQIPGLVQEKTFSPEEALKGRLAGEKIVILGGGMVGCEVAEYLAVQGKKVTLVEKLPEIAAGMETHTKTLLLERLRKLNVQMLTEAEVDSLQGNQAILVKKGERSRIECDGIVVALGARAERESDWVTCCVPVYAIGDCVEVRDVAAAIQEGFRVAREI